MYAPEQLPQSPAAAPSAPSQGFVMSSSQTVNGQSAIDRPIALAHLAESRDSMSNHRMSIRHTRAPVITIPIMLGLALAAALAVSTGATAAQADPGDAGFLGAAEPYAVVASATITNLDPTTISGDVGLYAGTDITGFGPATVAPGYEVHAGDAEALAAQSALVAPYNALASALDARGSATGVTVVSSDLGSFTPTGSSAGLYGPGIYSSGSGLALTGTMTLDAGNDPDAVFIFRAGPDLTIASGSTVALTNGAQWCNVYWQVGSSATLVSGATFIGTILANASISAQAGVNVTGRLLASAGSGGAGQVSLINDVIDASQGCTLPSGDTGPQSGSGPVAGGAPGTDSGGLAFTGTDPTIGLVVGSSALAVGLLAVVVARRFVVRRREN